jgi:hypothetical protein
MTNTPSVIINALPNVSNFGIVGSNVAMGSSSTVTISSTSLAVGTYTITYNLTGANSATGNTSSITMSSNSGTFSTSTLTNSGSTNVVISSIRNASNCTTNLSTGNNSSFTVYSNNSNLSALVLSNGTLSPSFSSSTISYTASVVNSISSITITPSKSNANASIQVRVNGGTYAGVTSGTASSSLSLNVGSNTIDVKVTAQDSTTIKTYTITITRAAGSAQLSITAFIEGLYLGSNTMIASPFAANGITPSNIADTIEVELHNATSPYNIAFSAKGTLSTAGIANIVFPASSIGNSYYLVIKHRNSIETWSALPISIAASTSYNFSSSISQAFGNNLSDMGNSKFAIYSGDINQDGSIDFADYPPLDLASQNGVLDYDSNDLNGDASVDFGDYPILDMNSSKGIFSIRP